MRMIAAVAGAALACMIGSSAGEARGHGHGFHGHRAGGFHVARPHCRTVRIDGRRERLCQ